VRLLRLLALAVLPALVLASPALARPCPGSDDLPAAARVDQMRAATACLINRERVRHGRARLRVNPLLDRSATAYARDMVADTFFAHVTPGGLSFRDRTRRGLLGRYARSARRWVLGENLAWGSGEEATPQAIVAAWMHSGAHRRNLLRKDYHDLGLGIVVGPPVRMATVSHAATYVTHFGLRVR
jgi:uncharacterized protein YkwD